MSNGEKNYSYTTKLNGNLLTVRGDDVQSFGQNIQALGADIGALINQMETAINGGSTLNNALGATPVDPPMNPEPVQQQEPPQQEQNPWGQGGQQPQGQWGNAQPAQQAPQGNQWGQPPAQQGWGGAPQQGGGAPQGDAPINPHTGQPMLFKEGTSKNSGKPYKMWCDERPFPQIKDLPDNMKAKPQFIR